MYFAEPREIRKIRGEILAEANTIERLLTKFLSDYFAGYREKELYDLILNTDLLTFRKKIDLFRKIIPKLDWTVNNEDRQEILIKSLVFVNEVRNKAAHWNWSQEKTKDEDYYLQNPRTTEILKLDTELLGRFNEAIGEILLFFDGWD